MRVDERSFLRQFAGTSMIPALLVWGMHTGKTDDMSKPMGYTEISELTGYTWYEVYSMCRLIDSLLVKESDNETTDIPR